VGNREALLDGATRCLYEKGYERTTVRDITAAAGGVSMAAIGYHFGSREALLNAAMINAIDKWGEEIERALAASVDPDATPAEQAEAVWMEMIASFTEHRRLWIASHEAFMQTEHSPELREQLAAGQREGRRGLAAIAAGVAEDDLDDETVRTVGSVQMALLAGVMMQWLLDPAHAPSGPEIIQGLRALVERIGPA
jgi:AcrR family transcriptional regulator